MSEKIDSDLNLDLHFLPSWAKEPSNRNLYADFQGESEGRGDRPRGDRPFRRQGPPGGGGGPGQRPPGGGGGGGRRPEGRRPDGPRGQGGPRRDDRGQVRPEGRFEPRAPREEPLPDVNVNFRPEEKGVESLARQIKMTGRAYPLFEVAQMVLAKPERHTVVFSVQKGEANQIVQPLFVCALDDSLWLSEAEAVEYVLNKHFETFYQAEKTPVDPPKGTYTFVAQCGMSGIILGPPNHHDYQNQLRKLHSERFSRMPFDVYKSRVKIVRDEETIKKWLESLSFKTEYTCLNMPEPLRLGSREEVVKHFRENHLPVIIKQVEAHTLTGVASRTMRCAPLQRLARAAWEEQRRFPMQTATVLSQQFASHGLQFFKFHKNVTHVAIARPHYLDMEATPISDGIKHIVDFINSHPKCTRRQLIEALAPAPTTVLVSHAPEAAPVAEVAADGTPAPAAPPAPPAPAAPTPEATVIISDLHWLVHQGHVVEFADGMLETAKKPLPKPIKAAKTPVVTLETLDDQPENDSAPSASYEPAPLPTPALAPAPAAPVAEEAPVPAAPAPEPAAPDEPPPASV